MKLSLDDLKLFEDAVSATLRTGDGVNAPRMTHHLPKEVLVEVHAVLARHFNSLAHLKPPPDRAYQIGCTSPNEDDALSALTGNDSKGGAA